MKKTVKITSKRQITIPAAIYKELGLSDGASLVMDSGPGYITLTDPLNGFYKLAGSLKTPEKYKGVDLDEAIDKGLEKYIKEKYKWLKKK